MIINATSVVPRLEVVFRAQHELLVKQKYKEDLLKASAPGGAMSRHNDTNLTEEEKFEAYKANNSLPEVDKRK